MSGKDIKTVLLAVLIVVLVQGDYQKAPYAEWAHDHLVWMNAKEQNESKVIDMVKTYQKCRFMIR